jgi:hypothetical protein
MQTFTVDLWEGFSYSGAMEDGFRPTLDAYILKSETLRPAVLILPVPVYSVTPASGSKIKPHI